MFRQTLQTSAFILLGMAWGLCGTTIAREMEDVAVLSLSSTDWRIREDADGKGAERGMAEADVSSPDWIPAAVPGNIQADLEAAHQLKPLWYGAGDSRMAEVAQKNWWYRKDFTVPPSFEGKRVKLVFDGVDHECEVWLNGKRLGRNAGMFKRFGFDTADAIRPGQVNRLAMKISRIPESLVAPMVSADARGGANVGIVSNKVRECLKELKSPTNSGYDWAVAVYTLGIWKDVRLEATGPARIDWIRVQSKLKDNYTKAIVRATLDIDSLDDVSAKARVCIEGQGREAIAEVVASLKKGRNLVEAELTLDRPALWWPAGQGDQPLYRLNATLENAATGEVLDSRSVRFGVREIRWEQCPGAPADFINPLKLVVNGRPVRQMGSNLLPPDSLFGRMMQRGPRLLELARESGINCLRLWGGGVILPERMYDRADELGIMLLAEFPLANCIPESDPVFLKNLEDTARNILAQTRNHPCIVEWTGGNELVWKNGDDIPSLRLLEKVVREDDGRIFRSTEPAQGSGPHGSYTYVYHARPAPELSWLGAGNVNLYHRYNTAVQMRISEFGTNSPANLEVWHREIPPSSQWPLDNLDDEILIRKNVFHGAMLPRNWLHKEIVESLFGPLDGLKQLVPAGQFLGAEGLRYAMDALRRNGPALGGGFMSWNYNEPWPNGAGSYMIDYDGRPLMNYDFVRQALAPVSLSLKYDSILYSPEQGVKAELFLTSDAPRALKNLKWSWKARDRRGFVFANGEGTVSIEPIEVKSLGAVELKPPVKTAFGPMFVELRLEDSDRKLLAERLHVFGLDGIAAPLAGLLENCGKDSDDDVKTPAGRPVRRTALEVKSLPARVEGDREVLELIVKNTGAMTALFCEPHPLIEYRTDLFIDNNHCFIPPGESRTITIRAACNSATPLSLAETGWRISCWNADDAVIEPSADVLLAVGRRDAMCREFLGYFDPKKIEGIESASLSGRRPDSAKLPYLLDSGKSARFEFPLSDAQAKRAARLRIHAADQSKEAETQVEAKINGTLLEQTLPRGLGIQKTDPAHLAFPATLEFSLPAGALRPGQNVLEFRVKNGGWFTWDAVDFTSTKE